MMVTPASKQGCRGSRDVGEFGRCLNRYGLEFIGQVYTAEFSKGHSVEEHLASLEREVQKLLPLSPLLVNIHSGEDTWSWDEMRRYFRKAIELEKAGGIPWAHETHRGRCLFHPTVAKMLLTEHPDLKLVADLSHWVCVCERLLEDQGDAIGLVAQPDFALARQGRAPRRDRKSPIRAASSSPPSERHLRPGGERSSTRCDAAGCRPSPSARSTDRSPT